ncbi:hypothetical protein SEA_CHEWYVIII_24 [Rhodococcus phage ChewyVIII]|uniref:Uncharacterized protein n=1 Tax=Rhodococcus phage ChewyVIII TaxID=1887657 RepID=A0A1C9EI41_9CAUD|nr:hypothetical protein QEH30_gp24 [Rhodococcus phage ChewyVIII]AON97446.1 hypothetical protein SEA_CHEWYVIII_24 [Rhodococcus phage ChewyVIII]
MREKPYTIDSLIAAQDAAKHYHAFRNGGAIKTRPLTYAERQSFEDAMAGNTKGFSKFVIHTTEEEHGIMAQDTQAAPIPNDGPSMHDLAVEVIQERKQVGLDEYGTLLQTKNGRDFLTDSIEEVADQLVYLLGAREEYREAKAEVKEKDRVIGVLKNDVVDLTNDIRTLRTDLEYTQLAHAQTESCGDKEIDRLNTVIEELKSERNLLRGANGRQAERLREAGKAIRDLRDEASGLREALAARVQEVEDLKSTPVDYQIGVPPEEHAKVKEDLKHTEAAMQNLNVAVGRLNAHIMKCNVNLTSRMNRIRLLEQTIDEANKDKNALFVLKPYDTLAEEK